MGLETTYGHVSFHSSFVCFYISFLLSFLLNYYIWLNCLGVLCMYYVHPEWLPQNNVQKERVTDICVLDCAVPCLFTRQCSTIYKYQTAVPHLCTRLCSATPLYRTVQCHVFVLDCAVPDLCTRQCSAVSAYQMVQRCMCSHHTVQCHIFVPDSAVSCLCTRWCSTVCVYQIVQCCICIPDSPMSVYQMVQRCMCLPDCSAVPSYQTVQCHVGVPDSATLCVFTRLCSAISSYQTVQCHICLPDCAVLYLCTRWCSAISLYQTVQLLPLYAKSQKTIIIFTTPRAVNHIIWMLITRRLETSNIASMYLHSCRPFTVVAQVRTRASSCLICGAQSGSGTSFFPPSSSVSLWQYNCTNYYYSFICYSCLIISESDISIKSLNNAFITRMHKSQVLGCCGN
jgi:hypothetical protein